MALVDTGKLVAMITLTALLCVSGVCIFIWMAATQWQDKAGLSVGIIFTSMGIAQALIAALWWRVAARDTKRSREGSPVKSVDADGIEMKMVPNLKNKAGSEPLLDVGAGDRSSNMARAYQTPQSLRSEASSMDALGTKSFNVSGSIPYVDATQSESSLA